ncbi:hypothetical protein F7725_007777 [Dissostichus mawsoni]|uniref:Uncharacterized protein n=1 Tax=Dissostichus mawsoni TaxID=36200 RepID=A0A7J5Y5B0_DISMA|nr:hypothetical protein F7725_007777 [Dissostichus mawsoni]
MDMYLPAVVCLVRVADSISFVHLCFCLYPYIRGPKQGSSPLTAGHYMIAEDQTIVSGSVLNVVDALMLMFAAYYSTSVIAQNWELPWSSCRGSRSIRTRGLKWRGRNKNKNSTR